MPGDSPPRGAEEPALGASLALLPRAALYITNPQRLQRSPGGTGDGYSVLVCQVMHGDLRPHPEQQRVALPAPARQQATAVRPRARRGTGHRNPPPQLPREPLLLRRAGQSPEPRERRRALSLSDAVRVGCVKRKDN